MTYTRYQAKLGSSDEPTYCGVVRQNAIDVLFATLRWAETSHGHVYEKVPGGNWTLIATLYKNN